ncbi:hypothetical protein [uncultured Rhodospira sp.]|uniref:hypothetical protein n=1 Tax=uncultured Rhodospira sp. TaxID=1936189 RepID=UPI002624B349|nr:hypothetical protein [uncultured Rhodospira sp.]
MRAVTGLLLAVLFLLPASYAGADDSYWTPDLRDRDRKEILDTLRPEVEKATIGLVRFKIQVLRTDGQWAYIQAIPQRRGGQPLEWWSTPLAEAWESGEMSEIVMGLSRREDDEWVLVDHVIGPTDVHWHAWVEQYGLPEALFSAPDGS